MNAIHNNMLAKCSEIKILKQNSYINPMLLIKVINWNHAFVRLLQLQISHLSLNENNDYCKNSFNLDEQWHKHGADYILERFLPYCI